MRFRTFVYTVLGIAACIGCSDSGPSVEPVQGLLTLDGVPLPHKSVVFMPLDGTAGHGSGCVSDAEGKYSLVAMVPGTVKTYAGVIPGNYRVTVTEPMFPPASSGSEEAIIAGAATISRPRNSTIPAIYHTKRSPLVIEVPKTGGIIDLELISKPAS